MGLRRRFLAFCKEVSEVGVLGVSRGGSRRGREVGVGRGFWRLRES